MPPLHHAVHALVLAHAMGGASRASQRAPGGRAAQRALLHASIAPEQLAAVAAPLLLAPLLATSVLALERSGALSAGADPTDWASTAWQWAEDEGETLFADGDLSVREHRGGEWRTLRLGRSIQSAAYFGPARCDDGGGSTTRAPVGTAPAYAYIKLMGALALAHVPALGEAELSARPFSALFLGAGACSLPLLLASAAPPPAAADASLPPSLTALDLDARVCDAARAYFGASDADPPIDLRVADAETAPRAFAGARLSLIAIDLFGADNSQPPAFATDEAWVRALRGALAEGGVLLANFHSGTDEARRVLARAQSAYARAFDGECVAWRVRGQANVLLCATSGTVGGTDGAHSATTLLDAGLRARAAARVHAAAQRAAWRFDARALVLRNSPIVPLLDQQ